MVVPDTLSRNSVPESLLQRCFNLLDGSKDDGGKGKTIQALLEARIAGNGLIAHDVRAEQQKEL